MKNVEKDIIDICSELKEPILFYLAILIRGYKDDIKCLFKLWKKEIKNNEILEEKNPQNFKIIFKEVLNRNKDKDFDIFLNNLYEFIKNYSDKNLKKLEGVLNVICHFYDNVNHKNEKEKSDQYNDEIYNLLLNNKRLTKNFFNFICFLDSRINCKNEIEIEEIWSIKTTCKKLKSIQILNKYYENYSKYKK